jgi:adenine deaminase
MTNRTKLIEAARGDRPLDLVLTNVNLVNVFTCEIYPADIGIFEDRVAVVGAAGAYHLEARQTIDGTGKWACPGFVDTHVHIESTMVTPANYAAAVLPFGTTTSIVDPHEIGNVLGLDGVRFMVEASQGIPLRVYITVSSCVPAVPGKETAGADFGPAEVAEMLTWPRVIAIAEVMDYMGLVKGSPRMVDIVQSGLAADVVIQGHSPLLMGRNLNAYIAGGIDNDHELRQGAEGLEKLRLGLLPLLKVSSYGNHVPNILPALKTVPYLEIALCTDDIEPADLLENGHMDRVIREMMSHGIEPAVAIRWATYVGARHYKLRDHGAIAPGYYADIVLLSSLEEVTTSEVLVGGKLVVENGRLLEPIQEPTTTVHLENSVHVRYPLSAETFRLKAPVKEGRVDLNLIAIQPNRMTDLETVSVPVSDYELDLAALGPDICYVSVVPRHGQPHPPTLALLKGLGLRRGTIASSIAHDSHNILVVGHLPDDMLLAVRRLEQCRGGVVIVNEGEIVAEVELPVAGLMSFKSVAELAGEMKILNDAARDCGININPQAPALAITGLALTVIPKVRISDLGSLFDVSSQEFRPVFP